MKWANFLHIYQPAEQQPGRPAYWQDSLKPSGFNSFRHGKTPVFPTPFPPAAYKFINLYLQDYALG